MQPKYSPLKPAPQVLVSQISRMQDLLQQYDIQNSYLNRQVLDLLNHKQHLKDSIKSSYADSRLNYTLRSTAQRGRTGSKLEETRNLVKDASTGKKRNYEYVTQGHEKYSQRDPSEKKRTALAESRNSRRFKYTEAGEASDHIRQSSYVIKNPESSIKYAKSAGGVQVQSHKDEETMMPILKKEVYLENTFRKNQTVEASNITVRSSRKRSPGISMVTSQKSLSKIEVQKQKNEGLTGDNKQQQVVEKQAQAKQSSPSKSQKRVSFTENLSHPQSITQSKLIKSAESPRKQQAPSILQTSTKNPLIVVETGVNTEPSPVQQPPQTVVYFQTSQVTRFQAQNLPRNPPHHRLNPCQRPSSQSNMPRNSSQASIRSSSKDKKKFINIVSKDVGKHLMEQKLGKR